MTTAEALVILALALIPAVLLHAMFTSRNALLGFPSAIFFALLGGRFYTLSTAAWDFNFIFAFACLLGMTTFCAFGAYGLREKRDTIADEEMENGEGGFIDEEGNGSKKEDIFADDGISSTHNPSERSRRIRERAGRRRSKPMRKGEFDF